MDMHFSRRLARLALPIAFQSLMLAMVAACDAFMLGRVSQDAMSAVSLASQVQFLQNMALFSVTAAAAIRDLLCCVTDGMAAGGGILVGNELGAGHLATGRLYGQRLAALSVAVGLAVMGVILLLAPVVPAWGWLDLTAAARSHLRGMLAILAVYMVGRCINTVVINGVFSAGGDTLFDVYSLAVCMWGLAVPLSILGAFVFRWNVLLVYACTCVDEVGKLPWVYAHFRRYKWVRDLTR